jgi:hypothetical protein
VLANKYVDGTPLYRLEQALARANIRARLAIAEYLRRYDPQQAVDRIKKLRNLRR